jgi:hypothetical protein
MVGAGVPRLVVSKILNHVETGVTAVYDRHAMISRNEPRRNLWISSERGSLAPKRTMKHG